MATLKEAVDDFLAQKRFAVAGVSRNDQEAANMIYRKLRNAGYEVYPTNPNAESVEGVKCYPDLESVPVEIDVAIVATNPGVSEQVVRECAKLGITRIWLHRSFGQGSFSDSAVSYARDNGLTIIAGGCPLMFVEPVDFGHKCIRWITGITGSLPKEV